MSRKRKAKATGGTALALWPCAKGEHRACTGGPVLVQHPLVTAGLASPQEHPSVRDFVCPCECHRKGRKKP